MTSRRRTRKRRQAHRKGPVSELQPVTFRLDGTAGLDAPEWPPWDFIYYDEPDYLHACPKCEQVHGTPMHSIRMRSARLRLTDPMDLSCPSCGFPEVIIPREEVESDGVYCYTIDRDVLIAAGLSEWQPPSILELGLVDKASGEHISIAVSSAKTTTLVVCDDCGMPFSYPGNSAFTTTAQSSVSFDFLASPCDHCGGFGHPLMASVTDGQFRTVSNSPTFADEMLTLLARELRAGSISVGAAASSLRARQQKPLTRLADWLEARPTSAMIAATFVSVTAGLLGPQIPTLVDHGDPAPLPAQQVLTEDQVLELLTEILDHFDKTHHREGPATPNRTDHIQ